MNQTIKDVRLVCLARKQRVKAPGFTQETKEKLPCWGEPTWLLPIMLFALPLDSHDSFKQISYDLNMKLYNSYASLCRMQWRHHCNIDLKFLNNYCVNSLS